MRGISNCLFVSSGIIVILEGDNGVELADNSVFELKTVEEALYYQGGELSIPFTENIVDHLIGTEEGNIYIYAGEDRMSLVHAATVSVDKALQLRAQGALWALDKQKAARNSTGGETKDAPEPTAEETFSGLLKYEGLKLPPDMKEKLRKRDDAPAAAS